MTDQIIDEETKEELKRRFSTMDKEVRLLYFEDNSHYNEQIKQLYKEISECSTKIKLEIFDLKNDRAKELNVTFGPVLVIKGENVKGDLRFYGIPAGYEFSTLVEIITNVSNIEKISKRMFEFAKSLNKPLKIEVFVTPTCPYCPTSAIFALRLAALSENVKGYVYEASEFMDLAARYNVRGVPKTVINDGMGGYEGGLPEDVAIFNIKKQLNL